MGKTRPPNTPAPPLHTWLRGGDPGAEVTPHPLMCDAVRRALQAVSEKMEAELASLAKSTQAKVGSSVRAHKTAPVYGCCMRGLILQARPNPLTLARAHTHAHAHTHTHTHTRTHTRTHTLTHTHARTHARARMQTCAHKCMCAFTHLPTHAPTYSSNTHARART